MSQRTGIYVDALSVSYNGGFGLRFDHLRRFALRNGGNTGRFNVYLAVDSERSVSDAIYRNKTNRFCEVLRDFEFKVIEKPVVVPKYTDSGEPLVRPSVSVDMAIDLIEQSKEHDTIVLLTSDPDFVRVIRTIQGIGCKVELVGFNNLPTILKKEADYFISGFLIPGLLPVTGNGAEWGKVGSRVRGVCYDYSHDDGYGFMRFLNRIDSPLWITDSRSEQSPYKTVFAHVSQFESNFDTSYLPSRDLIFEFKLVENDKGLIAEEIVLFSAP